MVYKLNLQNRMFKYSYKICIRIQTSVSDVFHNFHRNCINLNSISCAFTHFQISSDEPRQLINLCRSNIRTQQLLHGHLFVVSCISARKFFTKVELWGIMVYSSLMRLTVRPLVYTTTQRLRPTSSPVQVV